MATPNVEDEKTEKYEDEIQWKSHGGKYRYAGYGTKDVLFIVPDGSNVPAGAVPRKKREGLTDEEADKLENQGISKELQSDDLSIMKARFKSDERCTILDDMIGVLACDTLKKKITTVFNNTTKAIGKCINVPIIIL